MGIKQIQILNLSKQQIDNFIELYLLMYLKAHLLVSYEFSAISFA